MKKDIRVAICLLIIVLLAILGIYSLLAEKEDEEGSKVPLPDATLAPTPRTIILPGGEEKKLVLGTVRYYTVKLSTRNIESVEAAIGQGSEISPKQIAGYVTDALEDEEIDIEIKGIYLDEGICTLDFSQEIRKIAAKDSGLEKLILDAYAMSIVDNCQDIYGVSFKIEGESYSTGGISLKDGEVYLKS